MPVKKILKKMRKKEEKKAQKSMAKAQREADRQKAEGIAEADRMMAEYSEKDSYSFEVSSKNIEIITVGDVIGVEKASGLFEALEGISSKKHDSVLPTSVMGKGIFALRTSTLAVLGAFVGLMVATLALTVSKKVTEILYWIMSLLPCNPSGVVLTGIEIAITISGLLLGISGLIYQTLKDIYLNIPILIESDEVTELEVKRVHDIIRKKRTSKSFEAAVNSSNPSNAIDGDKLIDESDELLAEVIEKAIDEFKKEIAEKITYDDDLDFFDLDEPNQKLVDFYKTLVKSYVDTEKITNLEILDQYLNHCYDCRRERGPNERYTKEYVSAVVQTIKEKMSKKMEIALSSARPPDFNTIEYFRKQFSDGVEQKTFLSLISGLESALPIDVSLAYARVSSVYEVFNSEMEKKKKIMIQIKRQIIAMDYLSPYLQKKSHRIKEMLINSVELFNKDRTFLYYKSEVLDEEYLNSLTNNFKNKIKENLYDPYINSLNEMLYTSNYENFETVKNEMISILNELNLSSNSEDLRNDFEESVCITRLRFIDGLFLNIHRNAAKYALTFKQLGIKLPERVNIQAALEIYEMFLSEMSRKMLFNARGVVLNKAEECMGCRSCDILISDFDLFFQKEIEKFRGMIITFIAQSETPKDLFFLENYSPPFFDNTKHFLMRKFIREEELLRQDIKEFYLSNL